MKCGTWEITVEKGHNEIKINKYKRYIGTPREYEETSQSRVFVKDADERYEVHLEIDVDAIAKQLAYRAASSKTGVSKFMGGAVVMRRGKLVKRTEVKKESVAEVA